MLDHSSDNEQPASDPLSEILQDLRLSGVSYGRCELTHPWGVEFPPQRAARFHFVAEGGGWLNTPALGSVPLRMGDVVLLPRGTGHSLTAASEERTTPLDDLPFEEVGEEVYLVRAGGGGPRTILVCCSVDFEEPSIHPLLELMPPALLVREGGKADSALPALLNIMAEEVTVPRLGTATVMTRLADVVIARVVRAWAQARSKDTSGWLAAIRDPKIGRALVAIHRHPSRDWSVRALADVAMMSRSMFSKRFALLVGIPPAQYVVRWRMHLASVWLRERQLSVSEAAARLGYESEASFSRAFKRLMGMPPSALRRADRIVSSPASP